MVVRLLVELLGGSPEPQPPTPLPLLIISLAPPALLPKLHVVEVRPRLFSTALLLAAADDWLLMIMLLLDFMSLWGWLWSSGLAATLPGVRVGSSLGSFRLEPFQALPGTNSGIPKSVSSVALLLLFLSLLSGHPEPPLTAPLFPLDHVLPPSSRTLGDG